MYIGNSINDSPTITGKAAAAISDGCMKAAALSDAGVAVAGKGAAAVGLVIAETDEAIKAGDDVTIQVKDMGLWKTGAAIKPGDLLASDANGKAVKAASGDFIVAQALEEATEADQVVKVQIIKAGYAGA